MYRKNSALLLLLCFSTYLTAYILRVNLSAAIPQMTEQLIVSSTLLGVMGAAFFVTYAFGQLINGVIADVVSPFRFVLFGLVGTITVNLLISFCTNFTLIVCLWAANGYFQSIFWASLTRVLSLFFTPQKHSLVATVMSSSMVGGFLVSWIVLGKTLDGQPWHLFFLVPALIGTMMLAVWAAAAQKAKHIELPTHRFSPETFRKNIRLIVRKKIYLYLLICFCLGFVKESISVWGPTIAGKLMGASAAASTVVLLLIPFANLCGMFLAKLFIDRFRGNETKTLVLLFSCMAAGTLLLFLCRDHFAIASIVLLAEISAASYGCNSILLSFIPLSFAKYEIVSTTVGMFDFSSYIGAAISSVVMGAVLVDGNWYSAGLVWTVLAVLAVILCLFAKRTIKKARDAE